MAIDKVDYLDSILERGRYTSVANELLEMKGISVHTKLIFIYILSKPSRWRSSRNNIASNLEISKNTVSDSLKELEVRSMVSISKRVDNSWDLKILPPELWLKTPPHELLPDQKLGEISPTIRSTLKEEEKERKEILSLDDIYRRWLGSIPEKSDFHTVDDELRVLFETIKSHGYSADDLRSTFKTKVLKRWDKSRYPEKQEKQWDRLIGEILLSDVALSEPVERSPVDLKSKKSKGKEGEVDADYAIRITTDDDEIRKMMEEYERIRNGGDNE